MAFPRDGHSVYWGVKPIPLPRVAPRVRTQSHKAPSGRAVPRGLASLAITRGCCHHTPLSAQPAKCYHPEIRAFFFPFLFTAKDCFRAADLQHFTQCLTVPPAKNNSAPNSVYLCIQLAAPLAWEWLGAPISKPHPCLY